MYCKKPPWLSGKALGPSIKDVGNVEGGRGLCIADMGRCKGGRCQKISDIDPQFTICSMDFFCQYAFKWLETDSMLSSDFFISTSALYFLVLKLESCLAMHFTPLLISRLFHRLKNQKAYIHVKLYM